MRSWPTRVVLAVAFGACLLADLVLVGPTMALTPPTVAGAVSAPPGLVLRLPWAEGETHVLGPLRYDGLGSAGESIPASDHRCIVGAQQDCYALDVVSTPELPLTADQAVRPMFGGTVRFAGCATELFAAYGRIVYVEATLGEHVYGALYAHLGSLAPGIEAGAPVAESQPLGTFGATGSALTDGGWACEPAAGAAAPRLHVAVYEDALFCDPVAADGPPNGCANDGIGPHDGRAVVPEPLVGVEAYQDLGTFTGPMTASLTSQPPTPEPTSEPTPEPTAEPTPIPTDPEAYLLAGIPAAIRDDCAPRRNTLVPGTIAAFDCDPAGAPRIDKLAYFLMRPRDARLVFADRIADNRLRNGGDCAANRAGVESRGARASALCYVDDQGRANLRFAVRAECPAVYWSVLGTQRNVRQLAEQYQRVVGAPWTDPGRGGDDDAPGCTGALPAIAAPGAPRNVKVRVFEPFEDPQRELTAAMRQACRRAGIPLRGEFERCWAAEIGWDPAAGRVDRYLIRRKGVCWRYLDVDRPRLEVPTSQVIGRLDADERTYVFVKPWGDLGVGAMEGCDGHIQLVARNAAGETVVDLPRVTWEDGCIDAAADLDYCPDAPVL